jgi:hypothetical protein
MQRENATSLSPEALFKFARADVKGVTDSADSSEIPSSQPPQVVADSTTPPVPRRTVPSSLGLSNSRVDKVCSTPNWLSKLEFAG